MVAHLNIQPGQKALTPEQEIEARRFARERIEAQLSTEPVNEPKAERLLQQAYAAARLPPPKRIRWVDGPLQLVAALALHDARARWENVQDNVETSVRERVEASVRERVEASVRERVGASVESSMRESVQARVGDNGWASVRAIVWNTVWSSVRPGERKSMWDSIPENLMCRIRTSVQAYEQAPWLAFFRFFDEYLAPNALHALAHFNELVSGYWLGQEEAILVRRPCVLARDADGRLHCATGKCLEYRDGWGYYAWHGVRVHAQVILRPESLTREEFLHEQNVEVRRVIQERMGERFVYELSGAVLDSGPRGTLYGVCLPADDSEKIARYVQVQDASTARQYMVRVPPTIQSAAEAVAWSFRMTIEEYRPVQET